MRDGRDRRGRVFWDDDGSRFAVPSARIDGVAGY
jgi:hypothetical protein